MQIVMLNLFGPPSIELYEIGKWCPKVDAVVLHLWNGRKAQIEVIETNDARTVLEEISQACSGPRTSARYFSFEDIPDESLRILRRQFVIERYRPLSQTRHDFTSSLRALAQFGSVV